MGMRSASKSSHVNSLAQGWIIEKTREKPAVAPLEGQLQMNWHFGNTGWANQIRLMKPRFLPSQKINRTYAKKQGAIREIVGLATID